MHNRTGSISHYIPHLQAAVITEFMICNTQENVPAEFWASIAGLTLIEMDSSYFFRKIEIRARVATKKTIPCYFVSQVRDGNNITNIILYRS